MIELFNTVFIEPILALLVFFYDNFAFGSLGVAIIQLTLTIRIVLLPLFYRSAKDQAVIRKIQPEVEQIRKKHKDDREKQTKALMALYKEHKLNPFSGFMLLLVQIPIFIALFQIFRSNEIISETFSNPLFLNIFNLGVPSIGIALVAGLFQYLHGKMSLPKTKKINQKMAFMANLGKTMVYFGPIFTVAILSGLPSALALYWATSSLFSVGQQYIINRKLEDIENEPTSGRENKKSS